MPPDYLRVLKSSFHLFFDFESWPSVFSAHLNEVLNTNGLNVKLKCYQLVFLIVYSIKVVNGANHFHDYLNYLAL